MANNRVKSGILIMGKSKPLPVITDPVEARQAIVKDVLQRASQARSHFHVAPKEVRTSPSGRVYSSLHEKRNHEGLELLEQAGEIENLRWQVPFDIYINGIFITRYIADHVWFDKKLGKEIVADSKGKRTQLFIVKKRLMLVAFGIDVVEM